MLPDWFRIKKYPHIGKQVTANDFKWIKSYLSNAENIKHHSFIPFINRKVTKRKFRRIRDEHGRRTIERKLDFKTRDIHYACHLDSILYSFYAEKLSVEYEKILLERGLEKVPTAYRKIKKYENHNCCTIDFANEVFQKIKSIESGNYTAYVMDIKQFFDTLDHGILKEKWNRLLKTTALPEDHYAIFKSITSYSSCDENELFDNFKHKIIVDSGGVLKRKPIKRVKYLRSSKAVSICSVQDFRKEFVTKGFLKKNKTKKGIPQGSPISALLANVYLMDLDAELNEYCKEVNGFYRRYSDDIILIVDQVYSDRVKSVALECITKSKLEIQPTKIKEYKIEKSNEGIKVYRKNDLEYKRSKLDYLGFEFDGNLVYLRNGSLTKFYRKMHRALRRARFFSIHTSRIENRGVVFKRRLYKNFTHFGARRRARYLSDINGRPIRVVGYDWGNYISYVFKSMAIFNSPSLSSQIRNHWKILDGAVREIEKKATSKRRTTSAMVGPLRPGVSTP